MAAEEAIEAIHRAARDGDAVSVTKMLEEDPRLLSSEWKRETLLTRAVWDGNVYLVRLLLERGAEMNQADGYGSTALNAAAVRGLEDMVSFLITSGADPSIKGSWGQTALMSASSGGHVAVVRLLLRFTGGRDLLGRVLDERNEYGRTALWYACNRGHAEVLRALLLAGADHTIADNTDRTPLHVAEEGEHHECVACFQVSTSLVSRSKGRRNGTVFAVCGASVVWGRTSQSVPMLQWWERALQRAYVLHKARTLHEDAATRQQAPAAPVPAYLSARVQGGKRLPHVHIQASGGSGGRRTRGAARRIAERGGEAKEEEMCAMVGFVVKDLSAELYIELLAGFHQ
jgi:ankyrin repeat protein